MIRTPGERLDSLRRSTLAGLCFIVFGAVALFGVCVPLPALLLVTPRSRRALRVRGLASVGFRILIRMIEGCGLAKIELEGTETLATEGCLLVANHPSYLDAVFLMAYFPHVNCVMKPALLNHPLFFPFTRFGGYIAGSEQNPLKLVESCRAAAERGDTILIFPEGTRTTPGQPPEFHRGAAAIAVRGASVVTPVVISVTPTTLTKAEPWYGIPSRRFHFRLRVGEDIDPRQFTEQAPLPIASRKLNDHLHQHFMKELATDERSANRD